jgi:uncharacterized protein YigE (DUF2233 family)
MTNLQLNDNVPVMYFGTPTNMKVVEIDSNTGKIRLQFQNAYGSSWYTMEEISNHAKRIKQYWDAKYNTFSLFNDVDCNGNCYSDADPGL